MASAVGSGPQPHIPLTSMHPMIGPYAVAGQPVRYGPPMPNGYPGIPQPIPQGAMPPGGFFSLFRDELSVSQCLTVNVSISLFLRTIALYMVLIV